MADIYVSPTGNDGSGDGSEGNPYLTISFAYSVAAATDRILLTAGTHNPTAGIALTKSIWIEAVDEDITATTVHLPTTFSEWLVGSSTYVMKISGFTLLIESQSGFFFGTFRRPGQNSQFSRLFVDARSTSTGALIPFYDMYQNVDIINCTCRQTNGGGVYSWMWSNNATAGFDCRNNIFDKVQAGSGLGQNCPSGGYNIYPGAAGPNDIDYDTYGDAAIYEGVGPALLSTGPAVDAGVEIPPYTDGFFGPAPDIGAVEYVILANRLNGRLRVIVRSRRDGYASYQEHEFIVKRAGYGLNYGEYYGGPP